MANNIDSDPKGSIIDLTTEAPGSLETSTGMATQNIELNPQELSTDMDDRIKSGSPESAMDKMTSPVDFGRLIKDERCAISDTGIHIINLFDSAQTTLSVASLDERAKQFIDSVDKFAPKEQSELEADEFVWEFGESVLDISTAIPPRSSAQEMLVKTVALLKGTEETEQAKWKYLSDFGMSVRDNWNRQPSLEPDPDDDLDYTDDEWLNFSSFLARLYSERIVGWQNFPIWGLRSGLEYPLPEKPDGSAGDVWTRVACEWIFQSAPRILLESLLHTCSDEPEGGIHGRPFSGGPLYSGKSGFSLERWCFWKHRFSEIRAEAKEDLRAMVDEAMKIMSQAENNLGELAKGLVFGGNVGKAVEAGSMIYSNSLGHESQVKYEDHGEGGDCPETEIQEEPKDHTKQEHPTEH